MSCHVKELLSRNRLHGARKGAFWYDHRVVLTIEGDAQIEIFRRPYDGRPAIHLGTYNYTQLDPQNPPIGLRQINVLDNEQGVSVRWHSDP